MVETELARLKLFRFDPEIDKEPRYDIFEVPYKKYSVLDVLRHVYEKFDSTFAFRWACNGGFCRACVVLLNGKPALACMKPAVKNMKIEPHPKFEIITDLLIDLDRPKY